MKVILLTAGLRAEYGAAPNQIVEVPDTLALNYIERGIAQPQRTIESMQMAQPEVAAIRPPTGRKARTRGR